MNIAWHAATAIPFLFLGEPVAAVACVLPDAPWLVQEYRYRVALSRERGLSWYTWVRRPGALHKGALAAYHCTHSWLALFPLWALSPWVAGAWALHLALDLPTHWGPVQQRPLYPLSNWKWPYVLRSVRDAFK